MGFDRATWWQILLLALAINLATCLSSVLLWFRLVARGGVEAAARSVTRRDVVLTASTTLANALVLVPAWWAGRRGHITLVEPDPRRVVVETLVLLVGLDAVMYLLHRAFHADPLFRWFHRVHHTGDERPSALTLFVMHPAEAAGFGLCTLALLWSWSVSVVAIVVFFTINLVVGTAAHVPTPQNADRWHRRWLGGSVLHQQHHDAPDTNFGFFTQVWDRLLRTRAG